MAIQTSLSPQAQLRQLPPTQPVWIQIGQLLDGVSPGPHHDAHLVYRNDKILFVGTTEQLPPAETLRPGQSTPDCIFPEHTVLPGLIDGHTHIFLEGGELDFAKRKAYQSQPAPELLRLAQQRCRDMVAHGVVAVRDGGDKDGVGLALSADKRHSGVEVFSPGPGINRAKRYGRFFCEPFEDFGDAEAVVGDRIGRGADHIKIVPTGIINFAKAAVVAKPQYSVDEVQALTSAAHRHGKHVMAHASGAIGVGIAIEGGVDTIEHGFFIKDEQLLQMRDRGTTWVPTFAPVQVQVDEADAMGWGTLERDNLQLILDNHARSLAQALKLGVQVLVGSDAGSCGVAHADGLLYEMELMERAGMSSLDVINAATAGNASTLLDGVDVGQLAAGKRSRFILTHSDPLAGVSALRNERLIVFDGEISSSDGASQNAF